MKKIRNISIIITVFALIGVIGYICYNKYFKKQDTNDKFDSETIEIIKSAIGVDDVEFELDVLEYENNIVEENEVYNFIANIEFKEEQLDLLLEEMNKKGWKLFPGDYRLAFTDKTKETYSELTGQSDIIKENIYVLYAMREFGKFDYIEEDSNGAIGDVYYWETGDGYYRLYIKYVEMK